MHTCTPSKEMGEMGDSIVRVQAEITGAAILVRKQQMISWVSTYHSVKTSFDETNDEGHSNKTRRFTMASADPQCHHKSWPWHKQTGPCDSQTSCQILTSCTFNLPDAVTHQQNAPFPAMILTPNEMSFHPHPSQGPKCPEDHCYCLSLLRQK